MTAHYNDYTESDNYRHQNNRRSKHAGPSPKRKFCSRRSMTRTMSQDEIDEWMYSNYFHRKLNEDEYKSAVAYASTIYYFATDVVPGNKIYHAITGHYRGQIGRKADVDCLYKVSIPGLGVHLYYDSKAEFDTHLPFVENCGYYHPKKM